MAKIVTFYSYKGGTGRSMALANVAWVLASGGARVLAVDWDLEAPGLHRYFRPFLPDKELTRLESQGIIDLVVDFTERLGALASASEPPSPDWYRPHADIKKWTQRLLWPSGMDARTSLGGTVDFVAAGRQGALYGKKVNSFDWGRFYERHNGGAFMDAVRASMAGYDWVLIDSRTGVSDTSGICTVQFPDVLVVCFTLNYQSIDGAAAVAASAKDARGSRPLRVLPLPMRLDGNEEKSLKAMMAYAQTAFNPLMDSDLDRKKYWQEMGVPYFSRYAYAEKLAPFEEQVNVSTSTLPSIERLTSYITDGKISKLEPLPEADRAAALEEFERLPGDRGADAADPTRAAGRPSLVLLLRQAWYRFMSGAWNVQALVALAVAAIIVSLNNYMQKSAAPANVIPALMGDARKDLQNNNRDHAALLIAEAASRLGASAVVAPQGEPARQVYDAFLALQPLLLAKADGAAGVQTVAFGPDGPDGQRVASVSASRQARLFRIPQLGQAGGASIGYSAVAFSPDGRYVAAGGRNGSVTVYDAADSKRVWQWENSDPDSAWVNAVAFSPNGNLLAAGTDQGVIVVVRVEVWKELTRYTLKGPVASLAFSPDSLYLAGGGQTSEVLIWSVQPQKVVERLGPHQGSVRTVLFAPTTKPRRVATASGDGVVHLWTLTDNLPINVGIPVTPNAYAATFSPDGTILAVGGGDKVQLVHTDETVTESGVAIGLGKDSKPMLTYDRNRRGPFALLDAPDVRSLAFSADGRLLVTGSGDRTVRVWDVGARVELQRLTLAREVNAVALSANNRYLVIASTDGTFSAFATWKGRELTFPANEVQAFACSQVREMSLSPEEWRRYFGSEPVRFTCRPPTVIRLLGLLELR